jgi:amidase
VDERPSWEHLCAQKKAKIPRDWLLDASIVDRAKSTRKISGAFIEALLDPCVRDITARKTVKLVHNLRRGSLTAHVVTEAFCKRAAVAQQIVIPGRLP